MMIVYTHHVIKLAKELESQLVIDYNFDSFKYTVKIPQVFFRERKSYLKLPIEGFGYTIEDACNDYVRKARGELLIHCISDKTAEVI